MSVEQPGIAEKNVVDASREILQAAAVRVATERLNLGDWPGFRAALDASLELGHNPSSQDTSDVLDYFDIKV